MVHIPFLSEDEKLFLNTTATCSQARRMSNTLDHSVRPSIENNHHRRNQVVSTFLFKRRGSSTSSLTSSSSVDLQLISETDYPTTTTPKSPKARELESLIFSQPQRTVRLSLTPRCAV